MEIIIIIIAAFILGGEAEHQIEKHKQEVKTREELGIDK